MINNQKFYESNLKEIKKDYEKKIEDLKKYYENEIDEIVKDSEELHEEIKHYKSFFIPYSNFFEYIKDRTEKMIIRSEFPTEWKILQKGIKRWENKLNGVADKEVVATEKDLMDYYEED